MKIKKLVIFLLIGVLFVNVIFSSTKEEEKQYVKENFPSFYAVLEKDGYTDAISDDFLNDLKEGLVGIDDEFTQYDAWIALEKDLRVYFKTHVYFEVKPQDVNGKKRIAYLEKSGVDKASRTYSYNVNYRIECDNKLLDSVLGGVSKVYEEYELRPSLFDSLVNSSVGNYYILCFEIKDTNGNEIFSSNLRCSYGYYYHNPGSFDYFGCDYDSMEEFLEKEGKWSGNYYFTKSGITRDQAKILDSDEYVVEVTKVLAYNNDRTPIDVSSWEYFKDKK